MFVRLTRGEKCSSARCGVSEVEENLVYDVALKRRNEGQEVTGNLVGLVTNLSCIREA